MILCGSRKSREEAAHHLRFCCGGLFLVLAVLVLLVPPAFGLRGRQRDVWDGQEWSRMGAPARYTETEEASAGVPAGRRLDRDPAVEAVTWSSYLAGDPPTRPVDRRCPLGGGRSQPCAIVLSVSGIGTVIATRRTHRRPARLHRV
ncbi:hypothetical protein FJT64_023861 [Amphibalanus amphitrite]|uniref:Uncharacterized protein n=1 Tax=Amphibalanus amphitrite TaxID=1232801 RepID=A0A6A4WKI4_AMPAM|nr:hypothetical protein FJT64_023861 [Amphibalanus amphitrite]